MFKCMSYWNFIMCRRSFVPIIFNIIITIIIMIIYCRKTIFRFKEVWFILIFILIYKNIWLLKESGLFSFGLIEHELNSLIDVI